MRLVRLLFIPFFSTEKGCTARLKTLLLEAVKKTVMAEGSKNTGRGKQKPVVVPDMGRLQPQARELEEAVLGELM